MLKACICGAQEVSGDPANGYQATDVQKVGPVKATFKGTVAMSDMVEPEHQTVNLLSKVTLFCRSIMIPPLRDGRTVGEEPQPNQPAGQTIPILSMQIIPGCLSIAAR